MVYGIFSRIRSIIVGIVSELVRLRKQIVKFVAKGILIGTITTFVVAAAACTYSRSVTSGMETSIDVSMYTNHVPRMINPWLPNTTWLHVKPCALFFEEIDLLEETLQCANERVWPDEPLKLADVGIPACHVISRESPDIMRIGLLNVAVYRIGHVAFGAILGFYDTMLHETFIVENLDMKAVYRHEIQHHLLNKHPTHSEIGDHNHPIFQACEPATYTKSDALVLLEEFLGIED